VLPRFLSDRQRGENRVHPGQAEHLVVALRTAAQTLLERRSIRDLPQTMSDIVAAAVEIVPGATAGGISVSEDGVVDTRDPTGRGVGELDRLQGRLHEGPSITAMESPTGDGVVVAHDLGGVDRERWPRFAPPAVTAGYRSMLSAHLATLGPMRAALNLYAAEPHVFDLESRLLAGLFGVQAAMLLHGSEQAVHLARAVDSRDVIGQAKGVLMERFAVDETEAFGMLVESSQSTNLKLVDVARWLVAEVARRRTRRAATDARLEGRRPVATVDELLRPER
jgi:hypothetical protein